MADDVENSYSGPILISPFTGVHFVSENYSYDEEEYLLHYSLPYNIMPTIDMMALFTSLLTVFGFFTNIVAMGMLSAQIFERMSFAVLMKILCIYNIIVLLMGTIRYQSFYLDYRTHITEADRRNFCTSLLWFILVFRHARTASVMLILYNRIQSLSKPDCFHKYVDAIRLPILGNTLCLLVSTIPVSRYIFNLDARTDNYNRTECTFPYMSPYKKDVEFSADEMVSNLPIFEHGTIVCMLIFFFIKLYRRERRRRNSDFQSDSTTSTPPLPANLQATQQRLSGKKLRQQSSLGKFMTIITINVITSGMREAVDSLIVMEMFPITTTDKMAFKIRSFLDLSFFTFMATMFFFMCLTCTYFRQSAFNLLYSINVGDSHSESSLAYGSDSRLNALPIETILHTDALDTSISDRKNIGAPSVEGGEGGETLMTTGSVWSLDRNYFLSATRQQAVIETF